MYDYLLNLSLSSAVTLITPFSKGMGAKERSSAIGDALATTASPAPSVMGHILSILATEAGTQ